MHHQPGVGRGWRNYDYDHPASSVFQSENASEDQKSLKLWLDFRKFRPYLLKLEQSVKAVLRHHERAELLADIILYLNVMEDVMADKTHGELMIRGYIEKIHELQRKHPLPLPISTKNGSGDRFGGADGEDDDDDIIILDEVKAGSSSSSKKSGFSFLDTNEDDEFDEWGRPKRVPKSVPKATKVTADVTPEQGGYDYDREKVHVGNRSGFTDPDWKSQVPIIGGGGTSSNRTIGIGRGNGRGLLYRGDDDKRTPGPGDAGSGGMSEENKPKTSSSSIPDWFEDAVTVAEESLKHELHNHRFDKEEEDRKEKESREYSDRIKNAQYLAEICERRSPSDDRPDGSDLFTLVERQKRAEIKRKSAAAFENSPTPTPTDPRRAPPPPHGPATFCSPPPPYSPGSASVMMVGSPPMIDPRLPPPLPISGSAMQPFGYPPPPYGPRSVSMMMGVPPPPPPQQIVMNLTFPHPPGPYHHGFVPPPPVQMIPYPFVGHPGAVPSPFYQPYTLPPASVPPFYGYPFPPQQQQPPAPSYNNIPPPPPAGQFERFNEQPNYEHPSSDYHHDSYDNQETEAVGVDAPSIPTRREYTSEEIRDISLAKAKNCFHRRNRNPKNKKYYAPQQQRMKPYISPVPKPSSSSAVSSPSESQMPPKATAAAASSTRPRSQKDLQLSEAKQRWRAEDEAAAKKRALNKSSVLQEIRKSFDKR